MHEQVARAAAEESNRRLAFLAQAGHLLGRSLDFEATARDTARLAIPVLADVSALVLAEHIGEPSRTIMAEVAVDGGAKLVEYPGREGLPSFVLGMVERVLAGGAKEFLAESEGRRQVGSQEPDGRSQELPDTYSVAPLSTALVLPLQARDRVVGALVLALRPSGRQFGPPELALGEALASRAASALDNALLYRDVQRADRQKNEFLSMLAHELRNPLAPIRNAVQILRVRDPDHPELRWARDVIDRQVTQLVRLVDDLLDVSRITQGKIRLLTEPVAVEAIVSQAIETSRPLIDARRHQLTVTLAPDPLWVRGDAVRLAQVLTNLLNNAAKYTDEGGHIWLSVALEGNADRGSRIDDQQADSLGSHSSILDPRSSILEAPHVAIRVRDTGVGIPPAMLSTVFDLFTQVDRSLDRSQGGLGIGLTLVRHLIHMHDGTVHAFSPGPGQGSEFVIRLPALAAADRIVATENRGPADKRTRKSCRVLVVDDNRDAAFSLALLLRLDGYEIRSVYDGPTALEVAQAFQPQVVLLDIGLPGMDGYEVARHLRQLPGLTKVLLVAVTGYNQEEDRRRSQEVGFDHYLVKPVDPQMLSVLLAAHTGTERDTGKSAFAC
jgi:signal transduction histidine kinase/CheY-like chemotaxis protein